jgi:hypothetical protein
MKTDWHAFLAAAGARFTGDLAADFGDLQGELQAADSGTVLAPLSHLSLISCEGDDAQSFLHNQLTSDVNHLAADHAQLAAWCSAKGRIQASLLLWRSEDGYLLQVAADLAEATAKRLQMFVMRSKVTLAQRHDDLFLLGLAGANAAASLTAAGLPAPQEAYATAAFAAGRVANIGDQRFIVIAKAEAASGLWQQLAASARPVGLSAWQSLDIRAGQPLVTAATKEAFVPQMLNFDKLGGVSFHKGCYPGQEIVARTQYLGKVKRHMHRAHSTVALAAGDELYSNAVPDQSCGKVVTATPALQGGWDALVVIQADAASGPLAIGAFDGPSFSADAEPTIV